jgi:Family of unknown function (DUF6152)
VSNAVRKEVRNPRAHVERERLAGSVGALRWMVVAAAILVTTPCAAHHSFAMFDQSRSVTLHGVVRDFRWSNPHVFIQLLTASEAGSQDEWSIEMTSPEHLSRVGWRPGTLKPGDKVTLIIHPMRNTTKGGQYLSGIGPNGPLFGTPGAAVAPTGEGK